jgi:crotonobetainyl-CoA:carnitine CoA-transferase CaiB-like acyl-CoA transferase
MTGILNGLQVLDLSTTQAGAPVAQLLADHGADVLMVEPPGGSRLRQLPGFPFWARGRRSLELDLATPDGAAKLRGLAGRTDVLIETLRPGTLERLGLGDLTTLNPRLVHASITAFGSTGPLAHLPGYEAVVMAKIGGLTPFRQINRRPGPCFVSVPYATFSASQLALHGILAALLERETSGVGQKVEATLAQGFAAHDTWNWMANVITQKFPDAFIPSSPYTEDLIPVTGFPFRLPVLLTKDGVWLQFSQTFPHLFRSFLRVLDLEWMFDDPQWKGVPDLPTEPERVAFWEILIERARERTYAEWVEVFDSERNVWAEPFRQGRELMEHPQLLHDGQVITIHDAERGPVQQLGHLVRLASQPGQPSTTAPRLGEGGDAGFRPLVDADLPAVPVGQLPLAGITVLELSTMFAAPYAATLLTDLGARVYKVEPLTGDLIRFVLPMPELGGMKVMQGKESIAVDLRTDEGRQIVHDLAAKADVVVQSYRAGVAQRLGVDVETLRAINPDLVYLSAPGYGIDGPCGDRPAFAPNIGAAAGLARRNSGPGVPDGPDLTTEDIKRISIPMFISAAPVSAQADGFSALVGATGLLLGLLGRARRGDGDSVVTSMLTTTGHAIGDDMVSYEGRHAITTPDPDLWGLNALYRLYPAAEGWVFLACPKEQEWRTLAGALVAEADLASDPRFATAALRSTNDVDLVAVLTGIFARRKAHEWEALLAPLGLGCVEVEERGPELTLMTELGRDLGYVTDVIHPLYDEHPRLAPLVRFSRSATQARPACLNGQHTDDLLAEIGRTVEEINGLRDRGIVA